MIKSYKEYLEELNESKSIVKVETFKGYEKFTEDDIKDMIEYPKDYSSSDNLPKWIDTALMNTKLSSNKRKVVIQNILQAILDKKITEIKFLRDKNKNIIGLSDINIKDYN